MGFKGSEASEFSTPLLSTGKDGIEFHENEQSEASPMTLTLFFTALSATIGSYVFRYVAMGFAEVFCILGSVIKAFSKVVCCLYIGRMLIGCGVGIISYVVPVYIAEITPKNLRGPFTEGHMLMTCCGLSLTYLIGTFFNWRILAVIGTVPCIVQLPTLPFIPDSPKCLVGVGLMILQQFRGISGILFYTNSIFISTGFSYSIGIIPVGVFNVFIPAYTISLLMCAQFYIT